MLLTWHALSFQGISLTFPWALVSRSCFLTVAVAFCGFESIQECCAAEDIPIPTLNVRAAWFYPMHFLSLGLLTFPVCSRAEPGSFVCSLNHLQKKKKKCRSGISFLFSLGNIHVLNWHQHMIEIGHSLIQSFRNFCYFKACYYFQQLLLHHSAKYSHPELPDISVVLFQALTPQ